MDSLILSTLAGERFRGFKLVWLSFFFEGDGNVLGRGWTLFF